VAGSGYRKRTQSAALLRSGADRRSGEADYYRNLLYRQRSQELLIASNVREIEGGTAGDSNRTERYALERTAVWCQHCRGQGVGIPVEERGVTGKRRDDDCFRMMKKKVKRDAFLS
jgi:hypothetical protein